MNILFFILLLGINIGVSLLLALMIETIITSTIYTLIIKLGFLKYEFFYDLIDNVELRKNIDKHIRVFLFYVIYVYIAFILYDMIMV